MLDVNPDDLRGVWRFVIVQLLDDYTATMRSSSVADAAALFADAPRPSGDCRVDAALAALAEHLARRDEWPVPQWATDRLTPAVPWWFVAELTSLEATALQQSPLSFRKRGVFICDGALDRA
jgi:hypothetical protein